MKSGSRVLTVFSAGVHGKYKHAEDDFELERNYTIKNAADAAGYYMDAGFEHLSEANPDLVVAHAQPGFVATNWGTELPWFLRQAIIRPSQAVFATSLEDCGETLTESWLNLPSRGYHLIDPKGRTIRNGVQHQTKEERDMIVQQTEKLLPEI